MRTSSPRITTRVSLDTQELLSKAAALIGLSSINSFVLNAAIEKANMIVENENSIKLTQKDADLFINALEAPAQANENLSEAFKKHSDEIL
ncbi:MAG: DUF1778 domain-containing protein [Campylobacterota bacterium]|nr:DUF1778 domain-containing protein [Campylobacterota bacterium]